MNRDALAARLLTTFLDELDEQVRALNADLLVLEAQPADRDRLQSVFRIAHTLKGAARAANVPLVEEACHALESLLAEARDGSRRLGREEFELLFATADGLSDAGRRLRAGESLHASPLTAQLSALRQRTAGAPLPRRFPRADAGSSPPLAVSAARATAPPSPPPSPAAGPPGAAAPEAAVTQPSSPAAEPAVTQPSSPAVESGATMGDGQVRVVAEKLDALLATAGQLSIAAGRAETVAEELGTLQEFMVRWAEEWRRSRPQLRLALERSGASPRAMATLDTTERNVQHLVRESTRLAQDAATESHAVALVGDELMDAVRRIRMRPFAEAGEALPRLVRDLAASTHKEVELHVTGGDIEADRVVLDGLRDALVHLVRNAVDHGLEVPADRERVGKPRLGRIDIAARLEGDRIVVSVTDDGAGLDLRAIRARLASRGRPAPADPRALARVLFEGGFSTRREATAISGRGVGLDVVEAAVRRIRGTVDLHWTEGMGTTFTMSAPLTLATMRALLVSAGSQVLAIPTSAVQRLLRARPEELRQIDGRPVLPTPDGAVPLATLARLLGPPLAEKPASGSLLVVMLSSGGDRTGVVVDELLEEADLVVRPVERRGRPIPRIAGAALLATGRVALVVDPVALTHTDVVHEAAGGVLLAEPATEIPSRRRVLVADDSITTRTLEQSVLEAAGFEVLTAVDGADAWRTLQERGADLVVTDIEMPRMDGIALTEAIRASPRFQKLPVILVTSLETPEHRARGLEAGADAYVVKSSFDQEALLDTIRQLLR